MDDETIKFLIDNGLGAGGLSVVVAWLTWVWRKLHTRINQALAAYDERFEELYKCTIEVRRIVRDIQDGDQRDREARTRQHELEAIITRLRRGDRPDDDTSA